MDFYKDFVEDGNDIITKIAVSMKTTTTKDVKTWLSSEPIKKNIQFLKEGMEYGFSSNNKRMIIKNAEIHIYIPKENIYIKGNWLKVLKEEYPDIKFKINILEDFIK